MTAKKGSRASHRSKAILYQAAMLFAVTSGSMPAALGAVRTFVGTDGLWSDPTNWNPFGVPAANETVVLHAGTNSSVTITYDNSVTNTSFFSLQIDSMTGPISLVQTENTFSTSSSETVGEFGTGSFSLL